MPKISIIVPVYKVETYISKCIDSIIAQKYQDWELLLVDDGSPDSSGKICDRYSKTDSRIKTIHQQNSGVSSARNTGINYATGEWIVFVDSDDWIESNYLLDFFIDDLHVDSLVIQGMVLDDGKTLLPISFPEKDIYGTGFSLDIKQYRILYYGGPCCKLYRKSIIDNNGIRFPLDYSFGEDTVFFYQYLSYVRKIHLVNKANYHYMQHEEGSLTKTVHPFEKLNKYIMDSVEYLDICSKVHNDRSNILTKEFIDYMLPQMIRSCLNIFRLGYSKEQTYILLGKAKVSYGSLLSKYKSSSIGLIASLLFHMPVPLLYYILLVIYKIRG